MVLVVPQAWLVAIKGQSSGQDIVNVIGCEAPFMSAVQVAEAVALSWQDAAGPLSQHPTTYTMTEVTAMDISSPSGEVYSRASQGAGGLAGSLATNGSCALIKYSTGSRSKSQKGRMYHGPLTEAQVNADGRTLATALTLKAAYQNFWTSLEGRGVNWGIVSRKYQEINIINRANITTSPVIATQRRRIR